MSRDDGTDIYFYPDADGSIGSISYNGNRYYYVRNAQNDIIGITDKTGAFVARYTYDEWGNITSITDGEGNDVSTNAAHIANLNPFRYRSYFYDAETGWYWLNTRYYNPVVGRFLNLDCYVSTGQGILGHNMFAYCGNNPTNLYDLYGDFPHAILDTDGDGVTDCYLYTYTTTKKILWIFDAKVVGKVYIYINKRDAKDFDNMEKPEGFDKKTDLLVGDRTNDANATLFAYQAQHVKAEYRDEIVDILFKYSEDFGFEWDRTKESVLDEWKYHQVFSLAKRAQDIDFDEAEEGKNFVHFLFKVIKSLFS